MWRGRKFSDIMIPLKGARPKPHHSAHLDPDLVAAFQPRHQGWRPVLGQTGSSQGHLRNEGVGSGDLFLFFGLYRRVDKAGQFIRSEPRRHVIWGWLQVDEVIQVDRPFRDMAWVGNHPHIGRPPDPSNTLYRAKEQLSLPGQESLALPGAGVFDFYRPSLQLTDPEASGPSVWRLPHWFSPNGRASILSYHSSPSRWQPINDQVRLQAVGKGQEFVLNTEHYPESVSWVLSLLKALD
jgi:hypothetical protein